MRLAAPRPTARREPAVFGLGAAGPDAWVTLALGLWVVVGLACTAIWALTGQGGRWPVWVWVGAGTPVAAAAAVRAAWRVRPGPARWTAAHAGLAFVAALLLVSVWALTGLGEWLWWPLLGLAVAVTVHALLAFADRLPPRPREQMLSARVDQLERTRRDALDAQAAEMRRLERDLHDGAQTRLVSLSMLLGRVEDRVTADPDATALVRQARDEATAAIGELRTLSRGMAPPLLTERGLVAAIEALVRRSPVHAEIDAHVAGRTAPNVEAAAYFIVAEALNNVAKHAPGARARVTLTPGAGGLQVSVRDDGPGGADPAGSGLMGLHHRVAALDGRLEVGPVPDGAGTQVVAELPCEW